MPSFRTVRRLTELTCALVGLNKLQTETLAAVNTTRCASFTCFHTEHTHAHALPTGSRHTYRDRTKVIIIQSADNASIVVLSLLFTLDNVAALCFTNNTATHWVCSCLPPLASLEHSHTQIIMALASMSRATHGTAWLAHCVHVHHQCSV